MADSSRLKPIADRAQYLAALLAALGQVGLSALYLVKNAHFWLIARPYWVLLAGWLASLLVIHFPWKVRGTISDPLGRAITRRSLALQTRAWLTAVVTVSSMLAAGLVYYLESLPGTPTPMPTKGLARAIGLLQPTLVAAAPSTTVRMTLVDGMSSLTWKESAQGDFQVAPDPEFMKRFLLWRGHRADDTEFHDRILTWLRLRADARKLSFAERLHIRSAETNLVELTVKHSDVVAKLLPTAAEFAESTDADKEIIRHWVSRYVGQWRPRLRFTVDNTKGSSTVQVIAVRYLVSAVGQTRGSAVKSPQIPEFVYRLAHSTGVQRFPLANQGREQTVAARDTGTFDVILAPEQGAPVTPTWSGTIELETAEGSLPVGRLNVQTFNPERPEVSQHLRRP
jgi:hypothetical protein